ncbi:MAG: DUF11 domain-containing protein, partial [Candidatus Electrothrix sp. AX5]|nr:DUF11 domain-containing protein [Candidatus Electrothrix sp. AX5]
FADSGDAPLMTYSPPVLSVDKSSSAGGAVSPGDTITYTVDIENTGGSPLNNVVVTDAVPTGTTYLSGVVNGSQVNHVVFRDDFNAPGGGYSQSSGTADWSIQAWTETNDDGDAATGVIRIINGQLLMENTRSSNTAGAYLSRVVPGDLTGKELFLEVDIRETGEWETSDAFSVEVYDGVTWVSVDSMFPYNVPDLGDPTPYIFDLSSHANANTQIRFHTSTNFESIFVDYVRVYYSEINVVSGVAINPPPTVINSGDNFYLAASDDGGVGLGSGSDFMTITYQVTVDDPITGSLTSIDNTVSVTADELTPSEVTGSVSDALPPCSISGQVRLDVDGDGLTGGIADGDDTGIGAGVIIGLYDSAGTDPILDALGNPVTTTTDGSGNYTFTGMPPGDYTVKETNPVNHTSVTDLDGFNDDVVSVTVTAGSASTGNDFLDVQDPGSISGTVYLDADSDGAAIGDTGDTGIGAGVTVGLYDGTGTTAIVDGSGNPVTATTDASGNYIFNGVIPGDYTVKEVNPLNHTSVSDTYGDNDDSVDVTVTAGSASTGNNFLDKADQSSLGSISGQVRLDADRDGLTGGIADGDDTGIGAGVIISLYDSAGIQIKDAQGNPVTTTTDNNGDYTIIGVPPGDYIVKEVNPANYTSVTDKDNTNDDTISVTVTANAESTGNDFLDVPDPAVISGTVTLDADRDGLFIGDAEDTKLSGVTVQLFTDPNEDGDPSDGVQVGVDALTDVNGEYSFPNVPPGTYVVVETNPVNHSSVFDKDGDRSDPAANRIPVTAVAGGSHGGNDFLDVQDPAVISGTVTLDADRDGAFIGDAGDTNLSGVKVELFAADGLGNPTGAALDSAVTAADGTYNFADVPPGAYVIVETNLTNHSSVLDKDGDTSDPMANRIPVMATAGGNHSGNDFLDVQDPAVI